MYKIKEPKEPTIKGFKDGYSKSLTYEELDEVINSTLPPSEAEVLKNALKTVKDYTGITMRQNSLYSILKVRVEDGCFVA